MTTATHPLTGQPTATTMSGPQGAFSPGFPAPIGAEQIFGLVPPLTAATQPYTTVPWQQAIAPFAVSPVVAQVAAQITPMVQQTLLPYVIGVASQQVQQHLPQIVAQFVAHPGLQWQQYLTPMAGSGIFGQFSRPYSGYLS